MRVLVVDNNPTCLEKLEELLLHCNYHVTKTLDPKKATEMLREKNLPVILLSAHSNYDSVMEGIGHGACDYLVKPVGLKELQNIWQHVAKNIGSSPQLLPPFESHLAPSVSDKQKEKRKMSRGVKTVARSHTTGRGLVWFGHRSSTRSLSLLLSSWASTVSFLTCDVHLLFDAFMCGLSITEAVPGKYMNS